jgi:hypothetical protein
VLTAEKEKNLDCVDRGDAGIGQETACQLWVKDRFVDAAGIDDIMEEVFRMRLKDKNRITDELMTRFVVNNRINESWEREYRTALIDEFERRQLPYL